MTPFRPALPSLPGFPKWPCQEQSLKTSQPDCVMTLHWTQKNLPLTRLSRQWRTMSDLTKHEFKIRAKDLNQTNPSARRSRGSWFSCRSGGSLGNIDRHVSSPSVFTAWPIDWLPGAATHGFSRLSRVSLGACETIHALQMDELKEKNQR